MKLERYPRRNAIKDYFSLPNEIFDLGLSMGELSTYTYLLKCENRKTYKCYPSYKTIGKAINASVNSVKKYVSGLCEKGLISVERTHVFYKNGMKMNGSLMYNIRPIQEAINYDIEEKLEQDKLEYQRKCVSEILERQKMLI